MAMISAVFLAHNKYGTDNKLVRHTRWWDKYEE